MEDLSKYRSNSHKSRERIIVEETKTRRPKVEAVIPQPPKRRPKTVWEKVSGIFSPKDVLSYVYTDVVVPAFKDLAYDVVTKGSYHGIYGETRGVAPRSYRGPGGERYTSYNRPVTRESERDTTPKLDRRERSQHDFSRLVFPSIQRAEAVANRMLDRIDQYGVATVADFYDSMGMSYDFTDDSYGWTSLQGIRIRHVREGFILELPRPIQID